tara:strand:- start:774 stop:1607 length:834 start_codon:yes stop_codon:yes gene_type:complete
MKTDGNSYGTLTRLKTMLGITGTGNDTELLQSLEMASRSIDAYCRRKFYVTSETTQYRGEGNRLMLYDDLLSITTFTTLKDDRSTEKTWASTDYELFPLGDTRFPKEYIELADNTTAGSFANNRRRGVQIVGLFGYGTGSSATPYESATTTNDGSFDSSETTFTATAGANLNIGETILIDSEQMYISGISSDTITIKRAMNGTTGASHSTGATVYVYKYPQPIIQSCYLQAGRISKRWQTAYATTIGAVEMSPYDVTIGLDADVKRLLNQFVVMRVG